MRQRAVVLLLLALSTAGCSIDGSSEPADTTTTTAATTSTAATTTTAAPPMALTVYRVDGGLLRPRVVHVPRTRSVAAAALRALGVGGSIRIDGTTAVVDAPSATADEVAEIVYTLTQFSTIDAVDVAGRKGLTRDDFASYVPPIVVDSPTPGQSLPSPVRVAGSASVFEATLVVQAVRDGRVLSKQTVTASEGAPARGTFTATVDASPGPLTLQVYSPSAADGAPQHEVDVDLTVTP